MPRGRQRLASGLAHGDVELLPPSASKCVCTGCSMCALDISLQMNLATLHAGM
jgi:hypothetical protein